MNDFEYLEPTTISEACALLQKYGADARVYAGGAYLSILMKQGLLRPKALVNIKKISQLQGIRYDPTGGLVLGALVTHHEIETSALLKDKLPILCDVEREVANIRVRNVGTLGGNLASGEPLTDLAQVLISLDARVRITGPSGERVIPLEELFLDYYETSLGAADILTQVMIPPLAPRAGIEYIRFSSSSVVDKPSVGVAVLLSLQTETTNIQAAKIVLGCVAPVPTRARKAEQTLMGKSLSAALAEKAAAAASGECSPLSDLRGSEEYKRAIVRVLVKRAASKAYERAREN
ncbi:MAG: FAD binding domain-containing protein [Candidatus Binatia bacterium]